MYICFALWMRSHRLHDVVAGGGTDGGAVSAERTAERSKHMRAIDAVPRCSDSRDHAAQHRATETPCAAQKAAPRLLLSRLSRRNPSWVRSDFLGLARRWLGLAVEQRAQPSC